MACEQLGARLFAVRKAARLGMLALAKRSGVSSATINHIEKGRQLPAVDTVERLARALGIRPCWLAFGDGVPAAEPAAEKTPRGKGASFSSKSGGSMRILAKVTVHSGAK